jgi:hypothetical protein
MLLLGALAALVLSTRSAHAAGCSPVSGLSTCINADELWFAAGPSRFVGIASAEPLGARKFSFGVGTSYLSRPIVLHASSPDPEGRDIFVVDDALDTTWLFAYGVTRRLELTAALPFTLHQSGAGVEGVTSQSGPPLARTAVADPRVGAGFSIFHEASTGWQSDAKLLLDVALPLGDQSDFAGEGSFVEAPALVAELRAGRFSAAGEIGARFRSARAMAGQRVGSELVSMLGLEFDVLPHEVLSVGAEGWLFPSLVSQNYRASNGTLVQDATIVSAEWLASLRSSLAHHELELQLGGGTGIPLSSDRETLPDGTTRNESFSAVGTPDFRFVLSVRYTVH